MHCSKCGTESLPGERFCAECGSPFPIRCPECGVDSPANAKFCADCGTALAGVARPSSDAFAVPSSAANEIRVMTESADAMPAVEGERKTVTALFADLRGSTELLESLDLEEGRAIVEPLLEL